MKWFTRARMKDWVYRIRGADGHEVFMTHRNNFPEQGAEEIESAYKRIYGQECEVLAFCEKVK